MGGGEFQVSVNSNHVRITMAKEHVRNIPPRPRYGQQCASCCLDLTGSRTGYVEVFTLPTTGKTIHAYEALQAVFKGYVTTTFNLIAKDIKFCETCAKVFGKLLTFYTEFLQLSNVKSLVRKLVNGLPYQFAARHPSVTPTTPAVPLPCIIRVKSLSQQHNTSDPEEEFIPNHDGAKHEVNDFNITESENPDDVDNLAPFPSLERSQKNPIDTFECEQCGKTFQTHWKARMHTESEHDGLRKFRCNHCDNAYTNPKSLQRHEREQHKLIRRKNPVDAFTCDICGVSFQHHYHLTMHKEADHEGIRKFRCRLCICSFKTRKSLTAHERIRHKIRKMEPRTRVIIPEEDLALLTYKEYKCDTEGCESVALSSFKEWIVHQQEVHGVDTGYKNIENVETLEPKSLLVRPCPQCGKKLKTKVGIITHIKIAHLNLRPFECSICSKKFPTQKALDTHTRVVHEDEKYLCNLCGAILKNRVSMRIHERAHYGTEEKELKYECNMCKQKFISKSRLKDHMAMSHSDEVPYQCDQCEKKFKLERTLKSHKQYQHIDVVTLPHSCPLCNRRFPTKSRVKGHLMSGHKLNREAAESTANIKGRLFRILPNGDRFYKPEKKFKSKTCEICGRTYVRLEFLYTHLVKVHGKTEEEAKDITKLETKRILIKPENASEAPLTRSRKRKSSSTTETPTSSSNDQNYWERQQQYGHNYNFRY